MHLLDAFDSLLLVIPLGVDGAADAVRFAAVIRSTVWSLVPRY